MKKMSVCNGLDQNGIPVSMRLSYRYYRYLRALGSGSSNRPNAPSGAPFKQNQSCEICRGLLQVT
jgi:hypothetical protein